MLCKCLMCSFWKYLSFLPRNEHPKKKNHPDMNHYRSIYLNFKLEIHKQSPLHIKISNFRIKVEHLVSWKDITGQHSVSTDFSYYHGNDLSNAATCLKSWNYLGIWKMHQTMKQWTTKTSWIIMCYQKCYYKSWMTHMKNRL